jgi:hypothetical protein
LTSCLFGGITSAQVISVVNGAATPFGTAAGQSGGFNGSFQPSLPLYHIGGRGEAGLDLVWNFQPNWQAYKQPVGAVGSGVFLAIDPYPSNNVYGAVTNAFGLGSVGAVYARTGSTLISCGGPAYYPNTPSSTVTRIVFVTGTGSEVNLQDQATNGAAYNIPGPCSTYWTSADAGRGTVFVAQDGSALQFVADSNVLERNTVGNNGSGKVSGYLKFANGIVYRIDNSMVSWIRDRNGNWVNLYYNNTASYYPNWNFWVAAPTQIVDSDGRTVSINYSDSSCGGCATITYPGLGGYSRTIKVITASLSSPNALRNGFGVRTIDSLFPGTNQPASNYDPTVAKSIQFPDGSQYSFQYNSYGELARVNLPTGGAYEFDYGDGYNNLAGSGFAGSATDDNPVMIYRRLKERREYVDGSTLTSRTTFIVSYGSGTTTETDTVFDPGVNAKAQTAHTYFGSPLDALNVGGTGCNAWNEGLESQTTTGTPEHSAHSGQQLDATIRMCEQSTIAVGHDNQRSGPSEAGFVHVRSVQQRAQSEGI